MKSKNKPFISVIIATLNRTNYLEKCIKAILADNYYEYEVIIVDQGKDNQTKELIDGQFFANEKIRYLHTDTIGVSHARNLGCENARGKIIAFIDDDAFPVSGWLEAYSKAFSEIDPTPAMVGGKIEPIWELPKPKWYPKEREFLLGTYDIGDEIKPFPEPELPIGANFAILRNIIEDLGGFDDRIGFSESRRKSIITGEDALIGLRARDAGYAIFYQPDAKVYHHIRAAKLSRRYFLRRHYWEGVTQLLLEDCRKDLDNRKLLSILQWHLRNILKEGLGMCNYGFVKKANRSSKLMLHLSMIGISIGICVKSLQLLLSK